MAGFFRELMALDDPRVQEVMQRWGLYFRDRPLASSEDEDQASGSVTTPGAANAP